MFYTLAVTYPSHLFTGWTAGCFRRVFFPLCVCLFVYVKPFQPSFGIQRYTNIHCSRVCGFPLLFLYQSFQCKHTHTSIARYVEMSVFKHETLEETEWFGFENEDHLWACVNKTYGSRDTFYFKAIGISSPLSVYHWFQREQNLKIISENYWDCKWDVAYVCICAHTYVGMSV